MTFRTGDETRAKGVIWDCPVIPLTKWGIPFQAKNPPKKYQSNSILSPPLVTIASSEGDPRYLIMDINPKDCQICIASGLFYGILKAGRVFFWISFLT